MRDKVDQAADCIVEGDGVARFARRTFERQRYLAMANPQLLLRYARRALAANFALAFNAGTVALATFANGALGFVYWWVAARSFTPTAVGLASADISLMNLLSIAADVGLGTLLLGEIPRQRRLAPNLISAALIASLATAAIFGLAYLALSAVLAPSFAAIGGFPSTRVLVVVGIGVQTASIVLDSALVGMLSGTLRLFRNLLFAVTKLLLVSGAVTLMIPHDWQPDAIIASWVIAQCLASLALGVFLRGKAGRIWHRPRFDLLWQHAGIALWHYVLNLMAAAPALILPIIVASLLSPEQNAPFYAAWMLLTLANVVPSALATVLFAVGSSDASGTASSIRFSVRVSLVIGVIAAIGFWLLSNVALGMLNPVYPDLVGSDLRLLGVSIPLVAVKVHYMALRRLGGRVREGAFVLGAFAVVEIASAILGAKIGGLAGATDGWVLAMALEASCLWPTVLRRLRDEGASSPGLTAKSVLGSLARSTGGPLNDSQTSPRSQTETQKLTATFGSAPPLAWQTRLLKSRSGRTIEGRFRE
jgi:O-antigen/teichoic acid export membrane protein